MLDSYCSALAVLACTVCDSEIGQAVRAGIFGDSFWSTFIAVASPFPLLLCAIAGVHWRLSRKHGQRDQNN